MPEKGVLEVIGGTIVTAVGGWLAWLTTSRVPQKQFDQYRIDHDNIHAVLCKKITDDLNELKQGQGKIDEKVQNLTDTFIDYLTKK